MSEFREWLREKITRLDGVRERRTIVIGAMVLFLVLLSGPKTLRAFESLSGTLSSAHLRLHAPHPSSAKLTLHTNQTPLPCTSDTWSCKEWDGCTSDGIQTRTCAMTDDCSGVATPSPDLKRSCTPLLKPSL